MTPEEFRTRAAAAVAPIEPDAAAYTWLRANVTRRRTPLVPVAAGAAGVAGVAAVVAVSAGAATLVAPADAPRTTSQSVATSTSASPSPSSTASPDWRGPGTTKEQFLPLLTDAQKTVTWPEGYPMSAEFIWNKLADNARDSAYTRYDAHAFTAFNNLCAWTMQLVDDAGTPAATGDIRAIDRLTRAYPNLARMAGRITEPARRGDLTIARQFVKANGCARGFVPDDQISPPYEPGGG